MLLRHAEYQAEISGRQPAVDEFIRKGNNMIAAQHVLSSEISGKVGISNYLKLLLVKLSRLESRLQKDSPVTAEQFYLLNFL